MCPGHMTDRALRISFDMERIFFILWKGEWGVGDNVEMGCDFSSSVYFDTWFAIFG